MLTLHHLEYSRSQRVLWLLEELGVPYDLVRYARGDDFRAPPELAGIHPLGKSPVLVDGGLMLAESSVILRYLDETYGQGRWSPPAGSEDYWRHAEWLEYVEGSAALPVMVSLIGNMTGEKGPKLDGFCQAEAGKLLNHIAQGLHGRPFLMGDAVTLADMQMSYFLGMADMAGLLETHPALVSYYERLRAQPGFKRAEAKGGPMTPQGTATGQSGADDTRYEDATCS